MPIETFWVTGASADFELHICESTDRIVCLMFVPEEESREYGSRRAKTRSWIVRAGDVDEIRPDAPRKVLDNDNPAIVSIQVSGPLAADRGESAP